MPHFQLFALIRWLHFASFSIAGGAAVVALLLSGLEDSREDLRGLSATVWKHVVAWGFRLAVIFGGLLFTLKINQGGRPFSSNYFHIKLLLVLVLLAMSELSPKALARSKRGAPLLALLMFLLTTFVVVNKDAFGHRIELSPPDASVSAAPAP